MSHERRIQLIVLLSTVLLGVLLRSLPYGNFLDPAGGYLFYGPDSYDHLRRIVLGIHNFPFPPLFDSYYGYPAGSGVIWSSFLDYVISCFILIFSVGHPSTSFIHAFCFWLPPFIYIPTALLIFVLGKRFFGPAAGIVSALVLTLLPGHVVYSVVSQIDNNVVEPLVCIAVLLVVLSSAERTRNGSGTQYYRSALITGLSLGAAILFWRGSTLFWGTIFTALFAQAVADMVMKRENSAFLNYGKWTFMAAAATILPFCISGWWGTMRIQFNLLSSFHLVLLVVMSLSFALLHLLRTGHARMLLMILGLALTAAIITAMVPAAHNVMGELMSGFNVLGGRDPWIDSISEYRPMLFPAGTLDLWHPSETLSFLYWLIPLFLAEAARRWHRSGYADFRYAQLILFVVAFAILPLFRERYVHISAVAVALMGGMAWSIVSEACKKKGLKYPATVSAFLVMLCLLPASAFLRNVPDMKLPHTERYDLMETLRWMRANTPATSFRNNPVHRPEYGVLSPWSLGAYINYVAERPTVATNFGWETYGLFPSAAYLVTSDPDVAENILLQNNVRYLLIDQQTSSLPSFRAIAEHGIASGKFGEMILPPFEPLTSMYYRLLYQDGSSYEVEDLKVRALGRYRLIYQSRNKFRDPIAGMVSFCKIFEKVSGAVITGKAPAGTSVRLALRLRQPSETEFIYQDHATVGSDNTFTFRVPYATTSPSGIFLPQGSYVLNAGQQTFCAEATTEDIYSGREIRADAGRCR